MPESIVEFEAAGSVPVNVSLPLPVSPVPVGKGAVLFQSSQADDASVPVHVRIWLHVPFAIAQHLGAEAVGAGDVTFEGEVPLGKGAPVCAGPVPFEIPVPVRIGDAVVLEMVPLAVTVLFGNGTGAGEVVMGPISLPLEAVVKLELQQPLLVTVMELMIVEVIW